MFEASYLQVNDNVTVKRKFILNNLHICDYPSQINVLEGETIILPAYTSEISKHIYEFYKYVISQEDNNSNDALIVITSNLENITFEKNRILIKKLHPGKYCLHIKELH